MDNLFDLLSVMVVAPDRPDVWHAAAVRVTRSSLIPVISFLRVGDVLRVVSSGDGA